MTTPRSDVMYVVTEYGIVNLKGKSVAERAKSLIGIAHPDFGGKIFVMLDVGADPDCDAGVVGPGQFRSLDDGGVTEPVGIH